MPRQGKETGAELLERHRAEGLVHSILPELDDFDLDELRAMDRQLRLAVINGWDALGVRLRESDFDRPGEAGTTAKSKNRGGACSTEQGLGGGGFKEDQLQSRSRPTPTNCTPGSRLAAAPPPPGPPRAAASRRKP